MMTRRLAVLVFLAFGFLLPAKLFAADSEYVKLVVDYGDGVEKQFAKLPWQEKLTVLDALSLAVKHPRGIKVATQGKGELTLVIAIDELKNEGRGKNWVYRVNGKLGDRSCGVYELHSGDVVTWKFSDEKP